MDLQEIQGFPPGTTQLITMATWYPVRCDRWHVYFFVRLEHKSDYFVHTFYMMTGIAPNNSFRYHFLKKLELLITFNLF